MNDLQRLRGIETAARILVSYRHKETPGLDRLRDALAVKPDPTPAAQDVPYRERIRELVERNKELHEDRREVARRRDRAWCLALQAEDTEVIQRVTERFNVQRPIAAATEEVTDA